jgi:hypothetical protein
MASASKSIPFVVPVQPVPAVHLIPQQDLADVLELRQEIEELEAELKAAEQEIRDRFQPSLKSVLLVLKLALRSRFGGKGVSGGVQ